MRPFSYLYQINRSCGGVPKVPVPDARVSVEGLEGDRHRNKIVHGGPDRAVCVFSFEILESLQREGHPVFAGACGENLTVAGLDWSQIKPGHQLKIGEDVQIQITSYCEPCRQNAQWFSGQDYNRISHQHHPGWSRLYARVLSEGRIRQGDRVWAGMWSERTV